MCRERYLVVQVDDSTSVGSTCLFVSIENGIESLVDHALQNISVCAKKEVICLEITTRLIGNAKIVRARSQ